MRRVGWNAGAALRENKPIQNLCGRADTQGDFSMATKKTTKKTVQTWNNVKGLMRLWAAERGNKKKSWLSFSTSIGKKNEDEKYDNVYFDVLFKKNKAPVVDEGAFEINVKKGFLTLTVYSDGSVHPAVMVMEYDLKDGDEDDEDDKDDDLPF